MKKNLVSTIRLNTCLILFTLTMSCNQGIIYNRSYNPGYYQFSKKFNKNLNRQDSSVVYGYIKDAVTKEPLNYASIKLDDHSKIKSDAKGTYRFKEPYISEKIFLTANYIGYRKMETHRFLVSKGDSIRIDFYLYLDDRPIID